MCVLLFLNVATNFVTCETSYSRPGTIGRAGRVRPQTRPCIAPRPTARLSPLESALVVMACCWCGIGCHRMLVQARGICVVARKASGCVLWEGMRASDPGHADKVCIHPCHCIHVSCLLACQQLYTTTGCIRDPGVCHPGKDSTRTIQSLARPSGNPPNNLH